MPDSRKSPNPAAWWVTATLALACVFGGGLWAADAAKPADGPLDRLLGFGRMTSGAGECGAARTCVCHVETPTSVALQACVAGDRPALVVFDRPAEINVHERAIRIGSNKTIQGPATLTGDRALMFIDGRSNLVIRDLTFHSSLRDIRPGSNCVRAMKGRDTLGCGVMIAIQGNSQNIWIDHNEFYACGGKCITVYAFPEEGADSDVRLLAPDKITVSNNIFRDSFYGFLVGVGKATPQQIPRHERVTLYGNLFKAVHMRSPAVVSFAWAHFFNNLVMNWGGCYNCGYPAGLYPQLRCRVGGLWSGSAICRTELLRGAAGTGNMQASDCYRRL
jgi:pectate lyase